MKLYELGDEFEKLDELYLNSVDEETGEIKNIETIEEIESELENLLLHKAENIIKYVKNEESDIKAIKDEIDRLTLCKKRKEKKLENFKKYIESNLIKIGKNKIPTSNGSISIRKSHKTIIDENRIPKDERYWTQKIENKFDKTLIKKLLDAGEIIDGASIVETCNVNIK